MPSIERSRIINAPAARVYDAFVDFSRWLEWNPHLREVTPLSEGPLAPGFKARIALRLNPLPSIWEMIEVAPGRSFAWRSSPLPGIRLTFDHVAESADGGTRAVLRIDVEGPLSFAAALGGAVYGHNLDRSLTALKEMLEGEAAPAPGPQQPPAEEPAGATEGTPGAEAAPEAETAPKNE